MARQQRRRRRRQRPEREHIGAHVRYGAGVHAAREGGHGRIGKVVVANRHGHGGGP